jgi:polyisoprenoid-binding protein YceI
MVRIKRGRCKNTDIPKINNNKQKTKKKKNMKNFILDPLHSEIGFKIKHLMISTVTGNFAKFNATMESSLEDFTDAKINFTADVNSISTNISDRDSHLKSPDFFDTVNYPNIVFESTKVEKLGEDYAVHGNLTIKNVTLPITLKGAYNGNDVDAYGQTKYGFELEGKINRKDWGLTFNLEGGKGSLLIGDEVRLIISIQMTEIQNTEN